MGLASGEKDEIAIDHAERSTLLKCDGGRTAAEIVKHRIRNLRNFQIPGLAEFVME